MRATSIKSITAIFIQTLIILLAGQIFTFGLPRGSSHIWSQIKPGNLGTINEFNGSLNTSIPLLNIGGRGGTDLPLVLRLNQPWRKQFYNFVENGPYGYQYQRGCILDSEEGIPDKFHCVDTNGYATNSTNPDPVKLMVMPRLNTEFENAWQYSNSSRVTLGYGPGLLAGNTMIGKSEECTFPPPPPGQVQQKSYRPIATRFFITFTTSDGSSHELVDKNTLGKFRINTNTVCGEYSSDSTFSRGNTFVSTDGSKMTFISDTEITNDPITTDYYGGGTALALSGILKTSDGSVFRIDGGLISWIKDKNGNIINFTYYEAVGANIPKKLHTVTDSIGREVEIIYDVQDDLPYGLCDKIVYKGFNESEKIIRVSKTNLGNALRSGFSIRNSSDMWTATCESTGGCGMVIDPVVANAVWLPDGRSIKFQYNSFVEIARVELPTGGAVEYDHDYGTPNEVNYEQSSLSRKVVEKRVYLDTNNQGSLLSKEKYSRIYQNNITTVTIDSTDKNDNLFSRTISYFYGSPGYGYQPITPTFPYGIKSWKSGYKYKSVEYAKDGITPLQSTLVKSENKTVPWISNQEAAPNYDTRLINQVFVSIENGNALAVLNKTEYDDTGNSDPDYFSHLNVKKSKTYNYKVLDLNTAQNSDIGTIAGMFSESDLASVSETDYLYDAGYKARYILGLPFETRVMNPANPTQVLSRSQIVFDEQSQYYSMADYGSAVGYEAPTGTYAHLRGNATTHRTWFAEENRWIETHTQYDNFGNMRKAWDSSGDPNRFVETEYSSQHHYAYPTRKITKGPGDGTRGTTENSTITANYDFSTGLITSVTDDNGQVTTTEYDELLRPKRVIPPAGGGISEKIYGDTPGNYFVTTKTQVDAQNWAETTAFLDNLGRVYKTQTKDRQGDIFAEVEYDNFGRVEKVSNPYRQGEQKYWSKPRYDNRGRVVETYAPAPDGQTGASMGTIEFGISTISGLIGNYITATDASGRKARSFTNVYGQTVRVDEPTGNNDLGPLDNPNQASYYTYNIKGELVIVKQGNQNQTCGTTAQCRYFMYDSLGRLIRVRQPEQTPHSSLATTDNPDNNQWTSGFTYDVFSNVITVKDANGLTITNEYDKAGRVTKSIYSDGTTPQVDYFYDGTGFGLPQPPQFSKGSLTRISNGVSETRYTSFDNYGRVLTNQQITDGETYDFKYKYDSIGNLIEQTYPSMRVVKTHLDSDGGLAAVSSKTANSPFKTYASNFDYSATGNIKAMMLGNGRWETAVFNERQQIEQIGLGNTATDTSLWKVNYDYGELNTDGSVDANKNIGMVAKQTINLPTTSFVQTYKYDALNRLVEAKETANTTSGAENWKQTYGYDRFGNRTDFYQKIGDNVLTINNITKPQIDPATNRFTTAQGYVYDFNGNLVQDAENRQFAYNGDDQQKEVRDLNIPTTQQNPDANVIGRYFYDGEGKRVKKVTNFETTIFVYDGAGALVAEYSTQTNPEPTTSYMTTDNLGSPRVITDKNGNVISRRDFMPFGEEIYAGVGARDVNQKYSATGIDNIRQRFTGYEKDIETDLDFAEARMYKNRHARFTSPDPLLASTNLDNPQTFNRYVYVGNNPVNLTDPSGLNWCQDLSTSEVTFTGKGKKCTGNTSDVTGKFKIDTGSVTTDSGYKATAGDVVYLNADGSATLVSINQEKSAQEAANTGTEVQAQSDPVEVTNTSIITDISISQRPQNDVGDYLPPIPNPDPDDNLGKDFFNIVSLIPGPVGTFAGDIPLILIAFNEGNTEDAVDNIIGIIPFGDAIKIKKYIRRGPPNKANVRVDDKDGNLIAKWRENSGNMTDEEKALGFPESVKATHTEVRASKFPNVKRGDRMTITGINPPCSACKGTMNDLAKDTGAIVRYRYRKNGKTKIWYASPKQSERRRKAK